MKQVGARHDIIREWRSLPKEQRQTDEQAEAFAMQIKDKYKFSNDSADPYQTVRGWLLGYLSLMRGLGVNAKDKGNCATTKKPRQHSMKIWSASAKNAWFERRPRVRCSLPLQNCLTIRRLNAYCFPPGSRALSEQPT
jgi:hypothetical protein